MFDVFASESNQQYKQLIVMNRDDIQKQRIVEIMMKEDFIFIGSSPPTGQAVIQTLSSGNGSLTSSPVYGVVGSSPQDSPETQASMFANYVYGVSGSRDRHGNSYLNNSKEIIKMDIMRISIFVCFCFVAASLSVSE